MRAHPFRTLSWVPVVALALTTPLLTGHFALANATVEREAAEFRSDVESETDFDAQQRPPTLIEWNQGRPLWSGDPNDGMDGLFLIEEEPVVWAKPQGGQRSHIAIHGVQVGHQGEQMDRMVTVTGSLPTPCHRLGWGVPETASDDGVLRIEVWSVDTQTICVQQLQPFTVEIPLGSILFDKVVVNEAGPDLEDPSGEPADIRTIVPSSEFQIIGTHDPPPPIPLCWIGGVIRHCTPDEWPPPEQRAPFITSRGSTTSTPGPLPVAAALVGWQTARRLRRRCKP